MPFSGGTEARLRGALAFGALPPPLNGQTVFLANTLTGGGHEYLIGVFASESDAWIAAQREVNQGRKVWIEPHVVG